MCPTEAGFTRDRERLVGIAPVPNLLREAKRERGNLIPHYGSEIGLPFLSLRQIRAGS